MSSLSRPAGTMQEQRLLWGVPWISGNCQCLWASGPQNCVTLWLCLFYSFDRFTVLRDGSCCRHCWCENMERRKWMIHIYLKKAPRDSWTDFESSINVVLINYLEVKGVWGFVILHFGLNPFWMISKAQCDCNGTFRSIYIHIHISKVTYANSSEVDFSPFHLNRIMQQKMQHFKKTVTSQFIYKINT